MQPFLILSAVGCLVTFGGCTPEAGQDSTEMRAKNAQTARVIIKFRVPADASRPEFIKQLATSAGIELAYVRPLSGGAHLYSMKGARNPGELARAIERLSKRPDVEYAEPDRIMRIQ